MAVPVKAGSPARTPERSPVKRGPAITQAQKQALIDNLQLEITERARRLRAQYALHAQGLRSRLEMRINRIPQALRATNIEELVNKYSEPAAPPKSNPPAPAKATKTEASKPAIQMRPAATVAANPVRSRGTKRPSTEISTQSDKENAQEELNLPKKRAKTAATANTRAARTTSRKVHPSQVLSPKSNNSRTLPRSPIKPLPSPPKSYLARPTSPLKSATSTTAATASLAGMIAEKPRAPARAASRQAQNGPATATATATSTGPGRGRRAAGTAAAQPAKEGRGRPSHGSSASDTSAGTTIITKKKAQPAKKGIVGKVAGIATAAGRKATGTKKEAPAPATAPTGGRVLRARK